MTSRRTSGGFSCFTIDALIGDSDGSARRPPVADNDDWSTSTDYTSSDLQYVVSCSRLEDVGRSSSTRTTSTFADGLDRRRPVDEVDGGSRHAFRVYRPSSLQDVDSSRAPDCAGGILATLQRRAMSWYSVDVDNDRWRTPRLSDVSTGRRTNDIVSTSMSSTAHLHSNCEYRHSF